MGYQSCHQFSYSDTLQNASAKQLICFLTPYTQYLKSRGFELPKIEDDKREFDYQALHHIIRVPNEDTPNDLINALHCIHEMATPYEMGRMLDEAKICGISIDDAEIGSPTDIAIQIWMQDRRTLERMHVEKFIDKPCTFLYYQAAPDSVANANLSGDAITALEQNLDRCFRSHSLGYGCRVFCYLRQDGIWFMVCHGAYEDIENAEPFCICYRPERKDILIYHPATRELQIDAETKGEREIYRKLFGRHLFGNDNHFPGTAIYTLEPLTRDGSRSLVCSDVPEIKSVTLQKIERCWGNSIKITETLEASNVFRAMGIGGTGSLPGARITEACFLIQFTNSTSPRMVWVRPSNIIRFERDSDWKAVGSWLRLRGFVLTK